MMSADCVIHDGETSLTGIPAFQAYFDRLQAAFSDTRFQFEQVMAEGDLVCLRWSVTIRHVGDGLGIPPTGKELRSTGMSMVRIVDGKFVEGWQNWDMLGLMEQIHASGRAALYMAAG